MLPHLRSVGRAVPQHLLPSANDHRSSGPLKRLRWQLQVPSVLWRTHGVDLSRWVWDAPGPYPSNPDLKLLNWLIQEEPRMRRMPFHDEAVAEGLYNFAQTRQFGEYFRGKKDKNEPRRCYTWNYELQATARLLIPLLFRRTSCHWCRQKMEDDICLFARCSRCSPSLTGIICAQVWSPGNLKMGMFFFSFSVIWAGPATQVLLQCVPIPLTLCQKH